MRRTKLKKLNLDYRREKYTVNLTALSLLQLKYFFHFVLFQTHVAIAREIMGALLGG